MPDAHTTHGNLTSAPFLNDPVLAFAPLVSALMAEAAKAISGLPLASGFEHHDRLG